MNASYGTSLSMGHAGTKHALGEISVALCANAAEDSYQAGLNRLNVYYVLLYVTDFIPISVLEEII